MYNKAATIMFTGDTQHWQFSWLTGGKNTNSFGNNEQWNYKELN